jgi:hypothetical protein
VDVFQAMPADVARKLAPTDTLRVSTAAVKINIESDVSKRELRVHEKRAKLSCSNSSQSSTISSSLVLVAF